LVKINNLIGEVKKEEKTKESKAKNAKAITHLLSQGDGYPSNI